MILPSETKQSIPSFFNRQRVGIPSPASDRSLILEQTTRYHASSNQRVRRTRSCPRSRSEGNWWGRHSVYYARPDKITKGGLKVSCNSSGVTSITLFLNECESDYDRVTLSMAGPVRMACRPKCRCCPCRFPTSRSVSQPCRSGVHSGEGQCR